MHLIHYDDFAMKRIFGLALLLVVFALSCTNEPDTIPVTNVILSSSSVELVEGDSFLLEATISPSNATNTTVIWSTSNASVATVDRGKIQAHNPGNAIITVTSDDGGKTATCNVTVVARVIPVTGVSLNSTSLALRVGEQATLEATVLPSDATNKNVSWFSSNEGVATVSSTGTVFAIAAGTSVICVKTEDGNFEAQCQVVVTVAVSGLTLNPAEMTLDEGESKTITATITPSNATDQEVSWESSDPFVATVDGGQVTGVKAGTAVITATTKDGGRTASCTVTVIAHAKSVSLNKTSLRLEKGASETLQATVLPENTTDKSIVWSSSDEAVANVAEDGKVTAMGPGNATIIVKTMDGGKQAECAVTVIVSISSLSLDPSDLQLKVGETSTLALTISPDDATERDITWSSSSPSVATVKDGVVTAVKSGSTRITAKAGNGISATCDVTVIVPVTGISVNPQSLVLEQYTSGKITATVSPSGATDKSITWKSSDSSVATVSDGTVQALTPGTVEITATTVDGGYTATCSVTVEKEKTKVTSLSFDGTALYVGSGSTYSLKVNVEPEDAVGNFTWKSSDSGAVSVSGNGNTASVTSKYASTGYTTVSVTDQRTGLSASIKVYSFIQDFTWNESTGETYSGYPLITIPVGGTYQLKYSSGAGSSILNLFGDLDDFVFYEPTNVVSTPTNISISPEGLVTGLKEGTTGIKPTGYIQASGNRVYFKVASKMYESEYNDTKDYANNVPYGFPMVFSLMNTSDVDWFKLQTKSTSGYISVTLSVEYSGASSLSGNEARLCKYALYDSSMQLWGSGSFSFSNTSPTVSITKSTIPAGPLYLKVYFDTSYDSRLCPLDNMTLKLIEN